MDNKLEALMEKCLAELKDVNRQLEVKDAQIAALLGFATGGRQCVTGSGS